MAPLTQGVEHEGQVHLFEIAHAAVNEFGAAAGGFLGEVGALNDQRAIATSGSFNRGAQACGPAANYQLHPMAGFLSLIH